MLSSFALPVVILYYFVIVLATLCKFLRSFAHIAIAVAIIFNTFNVLQSFDSIARTVAIICNAFTVLQSFTNILIVLVIFRITCFNTIPFRYRHFTTVNVLRYFVYIVLSVAILCFVSTYCSY